MRLFGPLVLVTLMLSGCLPQQPTAEPTPAPSVTPVFATEEEALAAAEVAYGEFTRISSAVLSEGGVDPERLAAVATGDFLDQSIDGAESFALDGLRSVGMSSFSGLTLQQFVAEGGAESVIVYLCEDVSGVDVIDASGVSVVSNDRPGKTYLQVTFDEVGKQQLLVSGREAWGDGACQ